MRSHDRGVRHNGDSTPCRNQPTEGLTLRHSKSSCDHGPGIPQAEIDNIFLRLYRVDRSRARAVDGSGLGLAITKHLVLLHGGRITARSNASEGTVFELRLPRSG